MVLKKYPHPFVPPTNSRIDRLQGRLLVVAASFMVLYAAGLTISPAVRSRRWDVGLRWEHWLGVAVWGLVFLIAHHLTANYLPDRDPFILPIAGLLSGWGLLTIWRLFPFFGLRQTIWFIVALTIFALGIRLPDDLNYLRRYKYLWLSSGLLLSALTLIFGTNPMGYGPQMWLGCCGIYLQPSEILKLLLIIYLSAYFAGFPSPASSNRDTKTAAHSSDARRSRLFPILLPTLIMTGLALGLLLAQRDLGTATIFIFLYTIILYLASCKKRIILFSGVTLLLAGAVGFILFDVVQLRIEAWINPWLDPSGRSYQIVQSLIAVANGGLIGRGPGIGNPNLVPIPHSDFILAAIAEEGGFLALTALFSLIAILAVRGLVAAIRAGDVFRRYLAVGLTAYLVGQSIVIIGGNLRLLPLTGVTLPFVSYGGSSLVVSFIAILLMMQISNRSRHAVPAYLPDRRPYLYLGGVLLLGIAALSVTAGWWSFYRAPTLLSRTDNVRRSIADRIVIRGSILDSTEKSLAVSLGRPGEYTRSYLYPQLSPVVGYTHHAYGQAGIEASMDDYLRGLRALPVLQIWWNHLLYGQPPAGLDVRLNIDPSLQKIADQALAETSGSVVLIDAFTGEILVMASHPNFDANFLDEQWDKLIKNPEAPLLNRANQGSYPVESLKEWLFPDGIDRYQLHETPLIRLDTSDPTINEHGETYASPLHMAIIAATYAAGGSRPAPQIVNAVKSPTSGWVMLPPLAETHAVFSPTIANQRTGLFPTSPADFWYVEETTSLGSDPVTWYISGTQPREQDHAYAFAILIEGRNAELTSQIAEQLERALYIPSE